MLKERLDATEPVETETRGVFLARLWRCVRWINENQKNQLLMLCVNQKERAQDVMLLGGAKTKW